MDNTELLEEIINVKENALRYFKKQKIMNALDLEVLKTYFESIEDLFKEKEGDKNESN